MKILVDNLGNALKTQRVAMHLTLKQVSDQTELTSGYICRIENGSSIPGEEALRKLCSVYQMTIHTLVELENTQAQDSQSIDLKEMFLSHKVYVNNQELSPGECSAVIEFINDLRTHTTEGHKKQYLKLLSEIKKYSQLTMEG